MSLGGLSKARSAVVVTLAAAIVLSGCSGATAQRLRDAARVIGTRIGTSADEVEKGFRARFPTLSEAQLADEAEAAARRTAWIDDALARLAAERAKGAEVVQRATCRLIDAYDFLSRLSEADQAFEVRQIIVNELRLQGLPESDRNVAEAGSAIFEQMAALAAGGSVDLQSMYTDLWCWLET